jgi:hypothetical protein
MFDPLAAGSLVSRPIARTLAAASLLLTLAFPALAQQAPNVIDPPSATSTPPIVRGGIDGHGAEQFGGIINAITAAAADSVWSPNANVGPTARCAHAENDGSPFQAAAPVGSGDTVGFSADECSVIASGQWDITDARIFGGDTQLVVGVFGGYTSLDIDFDLSAQAAALGLLDGDSASNESFIVGGYATVARNGYYGVVSSGYMWGESTIDQRIQRAHGEYDNSAYSASGTIGKFIPLGGVLNVDFRGGLQYVNHQGDAFTDSVGNNFGESEISYWEGQVSVGLFGTITSGEVVYQPYVRAALASQFDYESTTVFNGVKYDFDSGDDLTLSLSAGALANLSKRVQLSGEVSFDHSESEDAVAGKVGIKFRF